MFTGIIESVGSVVKIEQEKSNIHFTLESSISNSLKIDQSLSHDGVCLTVVNVENGKHTVTAVEETLLRSNLSDWEVGSLVNLERAAQINARLDGHIVQGHVDTTGEIAEIKESGGSWYFLFGFAEEHSHLLVDKGSVTINGVSLTVVNPLKALFSVAVIPYTFENTNFKKLEIGSVVNLEFDIIGKYLTKLAAPYFQNISKKNS